MLIMTTTVAASCSYPERLEQFVNSLRSMIRARKMSFSSHPEKPPKGRLRIYSTTCLLVGQGIIDRLVPVIFVRPEALESRSITYLASQSSHRDEPGHKPRHSQPVPQPRTTQRTPRNARRQPMTQFVPISRLAVVGFKWSRPALSKEPAVSEARSGGPMVRVDETWIHDYRAISTPITSHHITSQTVINRPGRSCYTNPDSVVRLLRTTYAMGSAELSLGPPLYILSRLMTLTPSIGGGAGEGTFRGLRMTKKRNHSLS